MRADGSRSGWPVPEAVITAVQAADDGDSTPETCRAVADPVDQCQKL